MSNVPLTEVNLQSLQRSQGYGTPVADSGLMTSGLHALLDGGVAAGGNDASAPYLAPEDANGIVAGLLQQYYHIQEWSVPWPRPMTTPLLFVPDAITEAFAAPKAPTLADLEGMGIGMLEAIPLTHDLLFPEHERARAQLSREVEAGVAKVSSVGLHAPYQTALDRNPALDADDFALIDVDFCASGHGQRHLPSITFLQRPSYTEIGLTPAERREEERRQAIAQSMAPVVPTQQSAASASLAPQQTQLHLLGADSVGGAGSAASAWNVAASRTFKHAKQIDVCYDKWVSDAAALKFGLVPVHGHNSPLSAAAIAGLAGRILNLVGYVTANGTVIGVRRNGTNQSFYNTQQGKFVGAMVWKYICSLAAEAWGTTNAGNNKKGNNGPRLLHLAPATIAARILDDANYDDLALGTSEAKAALASALEAVLSDYTTALKQTVAANKKAPCPLIHTAEDFAFPRGLADEVLPAAADLVGADASALAQRPRTGVEAEVEAPLRLATNVDLHATLSKLANAGELSRRMTKAVGALPADAELLAGGDFRTEDLTRPNGAVPLAVMPVFPDGYTRIAAEAEAAEGGGVNFAALDLANKYRGVQHVVLNGVRNSFIPGAYAPTAERAPSVLFNDRLHFRPVAEEGSAVAGEKRTRRGESAAATSVFCDGDVASEAAGPSPAATTAYTTGTTHSKFEKYLADQSSTVSYVLKIHEGADDEANNGPVVTYSRIPTLTRYKRAQARITAEDVLKTVTISWNGSDAEARAEQTGLVAGEEGGDNDNAAAAAEPTAAKVEQ